MDSREVNTYGIRLFYIHLELLISNDKNVSDLVLDKSKYVVMLRVHKKREFVGHFTIDILDLSKISPMSGLGSSFTKRTCNRFTFSKNEQVI